MMGGKSDEHGTRAKAGERRVIGSLASHHKRLERFARERGLTMARHARMAVLGRLKADEAKGS